MEYDLSKLLKWFYANQLSINFGKTNHMLFKPQNMLFNNINYPDTLKFGTEELEKKANIKFLGMFFDENLSWTRHFNHLNSKLARATYTINMIKNYLHKECLKRLYYVLYYSHLIYIFFNSKSYFEETF